MNDPLPVAVGIDLGTTYSAVAYLDELGRPQTISNAEGDKLTPSAVLFEGDEAIVGKEALKALATDAADVAQCAKRELGVRMFHRPLAGREYPPEALQAWVLNKLRLDAARRVGNFRQAVITVPAYFDEVRRKATQDAGYMAGLDVLDIINEPTAAAVAYGYENGFLKQGAAAQAMNVLVYDLGGGTFDVTVMEIHGTDFVALATDGDVRLGGMDWDERLVDIVAQQFVSQHQLDPREDANTRGRLWRDCEDAKRTLSSREKTFVACDYRGQAVRVEITRAQFEELTHDLLDRTAFTTRQTLLASGLTWSDIDRILLVGGSSRMPAVTRMLHELSGKHPDAAVSPDEAVAHGAALRAGQLLSQSADQAPAFRIRNVNSHSLGVAATDPLTKRARTAVVIPRNTPLPASAKRFFKTQKTGQKTVLVKIVEGESTRPDDCSQLGQCIVRDLPHNLAAQTPIEVTFAYEENGRLTILVDVHGTSAVAKHEIIRDNSLNQEQLDTWRQYISKLPPGPGGG